MSSDARIEASLRAAEHLEKVITRAERVLAELREATSGGAGTLKDLNRAMKEAHAQVEEYAHDQMVEDIKKALDLATDRALRVMTAENEDFIARLKAAKAEACQEANEHLRGDWRLAVAVNQVGRTVWEALQYADRMPEQWKDVELSVPNHISIDYVRGTGHTPADGSIADG